MNSKWIGFSPWEALGEASIRYETGFSELTVAPGTGDDEFDVYSEPLMESPSHINGGSGYDTTNVFEEESR